MRRKLILLDLDGTIIDHGNNHVSEATKRAISQARANGHYVVIATGRTPSLFYGIDKTLGIDCYIAANGRYVRCQEHVLHCEYIPRAVVKRLNQNMVEKHIALGFETERDFVVNQSTPLVTLFCRYFHLQTPREDKDFHERNDILQMIIFEENSDLKALKRGYPELDFNISCPYGVDVNIAGGLKEYGMNMLAKHLGFDMKDTIAVGDGYNDVGMVQKAGFGIAMGNACEPLKKVADFVTDRCEDDGLYAALVEAGVIQ